MKPNKLSTYVTMLDQLGFDLLLAMAWIITSSIFYYANI